MSYGPWLFIIEPGPKCMSVFVVLGLGLVYKEFHLIHVNYFVASPILILHNFNKKDYIISAYSRSVKTAGMDSHTF